MVHYSRQMRAAPFGGGIQAVLVRLLISGMAVFLAVATVPGLEADSFGAGVAAVLVLTVLNLLLRPILMVLTLPLIVLSLGLFLLVLNALLLELTAYLVKGFTVTGFWPAVGGALVISIVTSALNLFTGDYRQIDVRTSEPRQPKIINPPE
ncbi:MAG TPA: phage holin family protein [Nitrospira sp.]|jgi:putative membrane protein|nr:phage holin family protein [Nitrospira sp.]